VPAVPQRIYLYNRQVLTGEQGLPASPQLAPFRVGAPDTDLLLLTSDVSALLEKASSPLLRALPDFERQFLRNLKRYCLLSISSYFFSYSSNISHFNAPSSTVHLQLHITKSPSTIWNFSFYINSVLVLNSLSSSIILNCFSGANTT
jgi:hypothetical protein